MAVLKLKVGDKVEIESLDWYNSHKNDRGVVVAGFMPFNKSMSKFCGKIATINKIIRNNNFFLNFIKLI